MNNYMPERRYLWVLGVPVLLALVALFVLGGDTNLDIEVRYEGIVVKSSTGDDVLLGIVTASAPGLMAPADKEKLDNMGGAAPRSAPMRKLHPVAAFDEWSVVTLPPPPSTTTLEVVARACQLARIWYGIGSVFETAMVSVAGIPSAGVHVGAGTVNLTVKAADPRLILSNGGMGDVAVGRVECY